LCCPLVTRRLQYTYNIPKLITLLYYYRFGTEGRWLAVDCTTHNIIIYYIIGRYLYVIRMYIGNINQNVIGKLASNRATSIMRVILRYIIIIGNNIIYVSLLLLLLLSLLLSRLVVCTIHRVPTLGYDETNRVHVRSYQIHVHGRCSILCNRIKNKTTAAAL